MLTVVKNECKILLLSVKYNLMKEMTNRVTFLTNVFFMMLNNASFIIQWLILYSLKEDIGGYAMKDVMLLWGLSAGTYGLGHIFFEKAYSLSELIMNGKLDSFLVQPKNVLLSVISSGTNTSAIGDLIYAYVILLIFNFNVKSFLLFTYFILLGALILTAFAVLTGSISFWIIRGDMLADNLNGIIINFSTYPDGIFKGIVRLILYTIIPVGMAIYLPLKVILQFHPLYLLGTTVFTASIILLAFWVFYRGLRRYTSSNLMSARI